MRKICFWRGVIAVDVSSPAAAAQLFIVSVVISMWNAGTAAAAAQWITIRQPSTSASPSVRVPDPGQVVRPGTHAS
jgi:hypothetical protein